MTAILLSILFMAGCGKKVSTYNYNVDDIKHCDNLYIKKRLCIMRTELKYILIPEIWKTFHFIAKVWETGQKKRIKTIN